MTSIIEQLGVGLHAGIPADIYHAQPYCSNSALNTMIATSPKHVHWERHNPSDPTDALILGNAVHVATLQPNLFDKEFVRAERCAAQKKDGERCVHPGKALVGDEWLCGTHLKSGRHEKIMDAIRGSLAESGHKHLKTSRFGSEYFTDPSDGTITRVSNHPPGAYGLARMVREGTKSIRVDLPPYGSDDPRTILSPDNYEKTMRMRDAIHGDAHAAEILKACPEREVSMVWQRGGLMMKGRVDLLGRAGCRAADLKTTEDASHRFERTIDDRGYYRQCAMYIWGLSVHGIPIDRYDIIGAEKSEPYAVAIHTLHDEDIDRAADEMQEPLEVYGECERTGVWPGYSPRVSRLPAYTAKRIEAAVAARGAA